MSVRKASLQEFQHQIKDLRGQLVDQIKCLEQRTDVQVSILHEVNDFLKKRAEIDLEYSKQLDKLVKSVMIKYKNEKQKRMNWTLYSTCNFWQQLVDDTKEEAKQRGITAEVYGNHVASSITTRCTALQRISKKCREIGVLAQGEIIRVLNELLIAMKTYQLCYVEFSIVNTKLQQAEAEKNKSQDINSTRKQKSIKKNFDKKFEKFEASRLKCNRARNEYLLCIDAANAALYKFFADDLSDLIDCTDLGMEYWLNLILSNIILARKAACQTEMNALANLGSLKESLQPQSDKQKFFESNNSTFMLRKRFEFKCDPTETVNTISLGGNLSEELKQRHHQICKRLTTLRLESDQSWRTLEETDQKIKDLLNVSTSVEITEHGIADHRPPTETLENELTKVYEFYLQNFGFYLFNANLIMRLEARADGIGNALLNSDVPNDVLSEDGAVVSNLSEELISNESNWHEQSRRKKRLGSQVSAVMNDFSGNGTINNVSNNLSSPRRRRPRLFGSSLEEYVEITNEKIPLIVTSCIRVLSQYALHHQGIFRVNGSQVEINHMKEAFENGEDPLKDVKDSSNVNSITSVLKLYFRELREPLFPFYLFELLTDCAKCLTTTDFINQITPLLNKLPRPTYLLLRYLFAFLNHLSEFSDENMMDPYNLAICFGPTLLPIPEGKDQVYYQNYVNEVVKNLIVHHDLIFTAKVFGPIYQKYDVVNATAATNSTDNTNDIELFVDESDEYFNNGLENNSLNKKLKNNATNSNDFFDYRNYTEEMLHNPYRVPHSYLNSQTYGEEKLIALMNSSNYSTGSSSALGLGSYSECLPPTITATLIKPKNNTSVVTNEANDTETNNSLESKAAPFPDDYFEKDKNLINNINNSKSSRLIEDVKSMCVVEEEDLDLFSSQFGVDLTNTENKRNNSLQKKLDQFSLSDKINDEKVSTECKTSFNSKPPVKNDKTEHLDVGSYNSSRDFEYSNQSSSRNSNRSNSIDCNNGTFNKNQSQDIKNCQNNNQLPPSPSRRIKKKKDVIEIPHSVTVTVQDSQYSQIIRPDRIRKPLIPKIHQKISETSNSKLNCNNLPSYDVLYGNKNCEDLLNKNKFLTSSVISTSSESVTNKTKSQNDNCAKPIICNQTLNSKEVAQNDSLSTNTLSESNKHKESAFKDELNNLLPKHLNTTNNIVNKNSVLCSQNNQAFYSKNLNQQSSTKISPEKKPIKG